MSSRRKMLMDQLFEKWDNDGSGYLDQDEVENVMMKYKDGQDSEAIEKGMTVNLIITLYIWAHRNSYKQSCFIKRSIAINIHQNNRHGESRKLLFYIEIQVLVRHVIIIVNDDDNGTI